MGVTLATPSTVAIVKPCSSPAAAPGPVQLVTIGLVANACEPATYLSVAILTGENRMLAPTLLLTALPLLILGSLPAQTTETPPTNRPRVALDSDRNGELSAKEIRNAAKALETLDADGDGRLSSEELGERRRSSRRRSDAPRSS